MKIIGKRSLLNLPGIESTGSIVAEVDLDADEWSAFTLAISDCDRTIRFNFAVATPEDRENNLYKIDTMIDCLKAFRKGVVIKNRQGVKAEESRKLQDFPDAED